MTTSVRFRILFALVGAVLLSSLWVGWSSYRTARSIIEQDAMRAVGAAAQARRRVLLGKLEHQRELGRYFLQQAGELCRQGERAPCARFLRDLVSNSGATAAEFRHIQRPPVTAGAAEAIQTEDPVPPGQVSRVGGDSRGRYYILSQSYTADCTLLLRFELRDVAPIFADRSGLGESGESFLTDNRGLFLTPGRYSPATNLSHPIEARPMELCLGGQNAQVLDKDYRGVDIIHGFRSLPELGGACIMAHIDVAEAFAPAHALRNETILSTLGFILLASLVAFIMARASTQPLRRLTERIHAFRAGDLSGRAPADAGPREVRQLARDFNEMACALEESRAALRAANEQLEQRVLERTKELAAANLELDQERTRLRLLLTITNALVSKLDLETLFLVASRSLRSLLPHDYIHLCLPDPKAERRRVLTVQYRDTEPELKESWLGPHTLTSPAGKVWMEQEPLLLEWLERGQYPSEETERLRALGVQSGCWMPLVAPERGTIGVLALTSVRKGAFHERDLPLLASISNQVALAIENALAYEEIARLSARLAKEKVYLEDEIRAVSGFEEIIGQSPGLREVLRQVEKVAGTDSTVLIMGETGTGKELIARALHRLSPRHERPFIKLSCGAIPATLLESELFGHTKGAFTGAVAEKMGRVEMAQGGTLFLDEVGELPLEVQPKLLRVLQEREFEPVGSNQTVRVDLRLVAATNRDLHKMVEENLFRRDLFYRLNVFPLTLPPLRERPDDIPALLRYFVQKYAAKLNRKIETIPAEIIMVLSNWHWPGNVRELENLIERAVILTRGSVLEVPLTEQCVLESMCRESTAASAPENLEAVEREHILRVLQETNWVIGGPQGAAARLGLKRTTLHARMRKLGIERPAGGDISTV